MLFCISDLIVNVKEVGSLAPYLNNYRYEGNAPVDIVIDPKGYELEKYGSALTDSDVHYLESGRMYHAKVLKYDGMYLHASAVEYQGKAYLFSAPSGTGKSTHTRLWQACFGEHARIFNDDKPTLRRLDNTWYAYGTPWCGKDHININMKVPVAGICFLKQGPQNKIRRLSSQEAVNRILSQTIRKFRTEARLDLLLGHLDKLVREIPIFELENLPVPEAAMLSYETMRKAAEEKGL